MPNTFNDLQKVLENSQQKCSMCKWKDSTTCLCKCVCAEITLSVGISLSSYLKIEEFRLAQEAHFFFFLLFWPGALSFRVLLFQEPQTFILLRCILPHNISLG